MGFTSLYEQRRAIIKRHLQKTGCTMSKLAQQLGCSKQAFYVALSDRSQGKSCPSFSIQAELSELFPDLPPWSWNVEGSVAFDKWIK